MVFRATLSNKVNFNPLESFPYLTLIHPRVQIDYRYLNYHMISPNDSFKESIKQLYFAKN